MDIFPRPGQPAEALAHGAAARGGPGISVAVDSVASEHEPERGRRESRARPGADGEVRAVLWRRAPASGRRAAGPVRARQLANDRNRARLGDRPSLGESRNAGRGRRPSLRRQALDVADGAIVAVQARVVAVPERRGAVQRQGQQGEHSEDSLAASWNYRFRSISHLQGCREKIRGGASRVSAAGADRRPSLRAQAEITPAPRA